MSYLIVAFDFKEKNIPLQPWKYLYELAIYLKKQKKVLILTNGEELANAHSKNYIQGIEVVYTKQIRNTEEFTHRCKQIIKENEIQELFFWASPLSLMFDSFFKKVSVPINLLYTGPIYYNKEILPVIFKIGKSNFNTYFKELITPLFLTKILINKNYIKRVYTLSERNKQRLISIGATQGKIVVTGIGKEITGLEEMVLKNKCVNNNHLIYITSASKIRGIELLLQAFSQVLTVMPTATLTILARPTSGNNIDLVTSLCNQLKIANNVKIVEGWLNKSEILSNLANAKILIMPFLLVPSEMPISIIESFSVGTPVIGPNLDGITELIEERGIAYSHTKSEELASAIYKLLNDTDLYNQYAANCLKFWQEMPNWDALFDNYKTYLCE